MDALRVPVVKDKESVQMIIMCVPRNSVIQPRGVTRKNYLALPVRMGMSVLRIVSVLLEYVEEGRDAIVSKKQTSV